MAKFDVTAQSLLNAPGLQWLETKFAQRSEPEESPVKLVDFPELRHEPVEMLILHFEVETDTPDEAKERTYASLEQTCKGAEEWRRETGVVFHDEVGDEDAESYEIADLFEVRVGETIG